MASLGRVVGEPDSWRQANRRIFSVLFSTTGANSNDLAMVFKFVWRIIQGEPQFD
jgi:hypothetical protein